MAEQLANRATSFLVASMDAVTDPITFNLGNGSGFPNAGNFRLRIDDEILLATARSGNSITANRAAEGTTIAAHEALATVSGVTTKGALEALITDHADAEDPHAAYELLSAKAQPSGYASLDGSGDVPDAQIATSIARTTDITTHEGAADPHTGYQRESEKGAASGYASLDSGTRVPVAQLGTGAPTGSLFLRDDRTWQTPPGVDTADHGGLTGLGDDDHTQYQKESERSAASGYASLDAGTKVPTAELGTGVADDTVFLRGDRSWSAAGSGVTDHGLLTGLTDDDHTQYQKESERSAASGYASLGANTLVPTAELGTGAAGATKYLRGDQTWGTPAGSTSVTQAVFTFPGTLFVTNGTHRWYADRAYNLTQVISSVGTAPTGDWVRLRLKKNGADTLFSPSGQRPTIATGTNVEIKTSGGGLPFAIAAGDYLTLDVVVIGSTQPGADLTCQVVLEAT